MSTELNFRQLIDLAIGSPEPGHVNFYALHFLLYSFAEKLQLMDEPVDNTKYENISDAMSGGKYGSERKRKSPDKKKKRGSGRLTGGADTDETEADAHTTVDEGDALDVEEGAEEELPEATLDDGMMVPEHDQTEELMGGAEEEAELNAESEIKPKPSHEQKSTTGIDITEITDTQKDGTPPSSMMEPKSSAEELDLTMHLGEPKVAGEVYRGVAIMKDQIELVMEQVRILVEIAIERRATPLRQEQLRALSKKMIAIQKENVYIENAYGFRIVDNIYEPFLFQGDEEMAEEGAEEATDLPSQPSIKSPILSRLQAVDRSQQQDQYDLDIHLCYSPDKLLDQLLDLKSEFCMLTNKVNEISASILEQDCQRTMMILQELQDQMKETKFYVLNFKEAAERMEAKTTNNTETLEELSQTMEELMNEKIDKSEIEILLADKVDYNQLQRKVSHEQIQEMQCRLDKQFCEMHKVIKANDKNMYRVMDNMRTSLGLSSVDEVLRRFQDKIEDEVKALQETLRKYMDATNDECAAAGARIKVLQDLACLSCDTTCVMRTMEKARVPKLANAHATNILSPLITYEIGSIRKSGIMGYFRKDEFPHAPNAWLNQQKVAMKMCVPRHAGGSHTTHTAKEHVEKVLLNKK